MPSPDPERSCRVAARPVNRGPPCEPARVMSGTSLRERHITVLVGAGLLAGLGLLVVVFLAALSLGWNPGLTV